MINKEKIMDKKITLKDLDFDYDVSGKGTKVKALKDMGVHNMDFDSLEDCIPMSTSKILQTIWVETPCLKCWTTMI